MANTFNSGTAGQVSVTGVVVAGIKSWKLDQVTAEVGIPHFESTTDSDDRMWPDYLFGLSGATGTLEGYFDTNAGNPTDATLTTGIEVTLRLRLNRATNWGFIVTANVTAFGAAAAVENQPNSFNLSFRVTGVVPISAVV